MNDKKQILMVVAAVGLMALIYFYFRKETEEVIANDIDGDSFNVKSEKEAIERDSSLTAMEKALAKEELNEISQLRIKYKQVFGAEPPISYTLIQLKTALETKEQADYLAACSAYKESIGTTVPASCKTAAEVNQAMSDRISEMRTEYAKHFKDNAPESMGYLQMKTAIEKDKQYQAGLLQRKQQAWRERMTAITSWASVWADVLNYQYCYKDWTATDTMGNMCNEFLGYGGQNPLRTDVERVFAYTKAMEVASSRWGYDFVAALEHDGRKCSNKNTRSLCGQCYGFIKGNTISYGSWNDCGEYGGLVNPYNIK